MFSWTNSPRIQVGPKELRSNQHPGCLVLDGFRILYSRRQIRLRGRGSGFLEGAAELDMPLQIHLSCSVTGLAWDAGLLPEFVFLFHFFFLVSDMWR